MGDGLPVAGDDDRLAAGGDFVDGGQASGLELGGSNGTGLRAPVIPAKVAICTDTVARG